MKLYSENKNYKLYQGSMLDMLEVIEPNSIDSIVTDPPYELNFMGKGWDNAGVSFQADTWKKCFEVLKPGGYLLAFGGSRTFHRIACAIEDAGFEIRDTIMWLYGCLSNDTEILTSNGWKNSENITTDDEIYSLDLEKDIIIKNKCSNVFKYDYDGEMVNLKNNNTNQLLTPNHHCIVKDKIKTQIKGETKYNTHNYWNYKDAWQIRSQTVKLPLAGNYDGKLEIGNLFAELLGWVISEGTYLKDTNAIMITQSSVNQKYVERIRYILGKLHIKYSEYSRERTYKNKTYTEYDFYIGKQAEKIVNKIKELAPNKKLNWGLLELSLSNKEFLIKGLLQGDGAKSNNTLDFNAFYQKDIEELQIFQTLLHLTGKQGWINEKKYSCSIHNNPITELQGKHFKDRFVKYNGKYVWCIETEIGNFIAKRDGKIFITGNSGFPKSMNIGLAVDKKNGVESKVVAEGKSGVSSRAYQSEELTTAGAYEIKEAQNEWNGWGTALKPSYESIIVAQKPYSIEIYLLIGILDILNEVIEKCQLNLNANIAKKISKLNQAKQNVEENIVLNNAESKMFTKEDLLEVMDMLQSILAENTNLNIELSCLNFLVEICNQMNKYTTETKINLITELKILKLLVVQNILENITNTKQMKQIGMKQNVLTVEEFLKEEKMKLNYMNILSAQDNVILKEEKNDLHPSLNQIIVARKPFKGSCLDNVIKHGVGGINIDECRVGDEERFSPKATLGDSGIYNWNNETNENEEYKGKMVTGRFPANTILTYDETDFDEVCGGFPNTKSTYNKDSKHETEIHRDNADILKYGFKTRIDSSSYNDSGSASRYFYCAKASKKDRDEGCDMLGDGLLRRMRPDKDDSNPTGLNKEGRFAPVVRKNTHPTVKPTELMQYLVRLVTPNGGTVLDPFNGSGSTGKAVMYENKERHKDYKYIGIELTEEYLPISQARIEYVCKPQQMSIEDL